jgi:hypothetical protein
MFHVLKTNKYKLYKKSKTKMNIMNNNPLKESIDISKVATLEIFAIMKELDVQNEKLVNIQKSASITKQLLYSNSKLVDNLLKCVKVGSVVILMIFVVLLALTLFIKYSL